ncbi:hypothetical protein GCM10009593_37350 [Microlunatus antarcticus]
MKFGSKPVIPAPRRRETARRSSSEWAPIPVRSRSERIEVLPQQPGCRAKERSRSSCRTARFCFAWSIRAMPRGRPGEGPTGRRLRLDLPEPDGALLGQQCIGPQRQERRPEPGLGQRRRRVQTVDTTAEREPLARLHLVLDLAVRHAGSTRLRQRDDAGLAKEVFSNGAGHTCSSKAVRRDPLLGRWPVDLLLPQRPQVCTTGQKF